MEKKLKPEKYSLGISPVENREASEYFEEKLDQANEFVGILKAMKHGDYIEGSPVKNESRIDQVERLISETHRRAENFLGKVWGEVDSEMATVDEYDREVFCRLFSFYPDGKVEVDSGVTGVNITVEQNDYTRLRGGGHNALASAAFATFIGGIQVNVYNRQSQIKVLSSFQKFNEYEVHEGTHSLVNIVEETTSILSPSIGKESSPEVLFGNIKKFRNYVRLSAISEILAYRRAGEN